MRSNDRTLLASLGFADPDKRNERHDHACQWLVLNGESINKNKAYRYIKGELEKVVSKGTGQYQTHVGFLDVVLRYNYSAWSRRVGESWRQCSETDPGAEHGEYEYSVGVEVKIERVSVNQILRQIKLYRQFVKPAQWLLATGFTLSAQELQLLKSEGIAHILLSPEALGEAPKVPSHEGQEASQPLTLF